jgi:hypothetical protein
VRPEVLPAEYGPTECGPTCTPDAHAYCVEVLGVSHPWEERYQAATGFPDPQPEEGGCSLCHDLAPLTTMLRRCLNALDERNAAAFRAEIEELLR